MIKLVWTEQLNTGIEEIDQQHQQIVDYINQVTDALYSGLPRKKTGKIIDDLVDFTIYHFGFEESLLEKSGYPFLKAHQKAHVLYAQGISDFQSRFEKGEDLSKDVDSLLDKWFFDHLKHDDADFVEYVKEYLLRHPEARTEKKGLLSRLFG
jgi:hemerythrin